MKKTQESDATLLDNDVAKIDKARVLKAHRKGRKPYRLKYPFKHGDYELIDGNTEWHEEEIVEFWMRRPILRDRFFSEKRAKDNLEHLTMLIIAATCSANKKTEASNEEMIGNLDAETDLIALVNLMNSFSGQGNISGNTLHLTYPFTIKGKKDKPDKLVSEITLSRPKSIDFIKHKNETTFEKIARLAGYPVNDLLDMDFKTDWEGLVSIFNTFQHG